MTFIVLNIIPFMRYLSSLFLFFLLVSCRSHDVPRIAQMDTDRHESHLLQRIDTIYRHDSIYIREVQRGDTVYLTRVEWCDRWRTRVERDTVVDVRVEKEVVQLPPERYIPKFYRWCTALLWIIFFIYIAYLFLRSKIPRL